MILTWDSYLHFFDLPESTMLKADASPAAAFQEITPTISVSDDSREPLCLKCDDVLRGALKPLLVSLSPRRNSRPCCRSLGHPFAVCLVPRSNWRPHLSVTL